MNSSTNTQVDKCGISPRSEISAVNQPEITTQRRTVENTPTIPQLEADLEATEVRLKTLESDMHAKHLAYKQSEVAWENLLFEVHQRKSDINEAKAKGLLAERERLLAQKRTLTEQEHNVSPGGRW